MIRRLFFLFIVLFWVAMNAWLWHSEIRGQNDVGASVPVGVLWEKILTAPDDSSLEIFHQGNKIGHCRWRANVGEELESGKLSSDAYEPEGRVTHRSGYTIDLEGNFVSQPLGGLLRFNLHSEFATNHHWKEFTLRGSVRPRQWQVHSAAADERIDFRIDEGESKWERELTFAELRDPGKLLAELGVPLPMGMLSQWIPAPVQGNVALGLAWEARADWFKIGRSKVRAYRLQARLLDRYQVVVILSRVGEILRVELPNDIVLVNDGLVNF
jgi:hypothetical protein